MWTGSSPFRESALLESARPDPLDDPLCVSAPHERQLRVALAAGVIAAVAWGALVRVDRIEIREGLVVFGGERTALAAGAGGTVVELLAGDGDPVRPGQVVARIEGPETALRIALAEARLAVVEARSLASDADSEPPALEVARADLEAAEAAAEVISPVAGILVLNDLAVGVPVSEGQPVAEVRADGGLPEVLVAVEDGLAARISRGAAVAVRLGASEEPASSVLEEVLDPSASSLAARASFASESARLVRLALPPGTPGVREGAAARVAIPTGRTSPLALLLPDP